MKSAQKKQLGNYQKHLIESLKDSDEATAYLNAALEDDDPQSFLVALKKIVEANGISRTARLSGLNRVSLYKMLSKKGNPSMTSLYAVLRALGLALRIDHSPEAA